jgi:competence protein ComEC
MKAPLAYLAVLMILGISLAGVFDIPLAHIFILSAALSVAAFISLKNRHISHACLYLAIFFLGVLSFRASDILPADHISRIVSAKGEKIFLKGIVADDPSTVKTFYGGYKTIFTLRSSSCKTKDAWQDVKGLVKVDINSKTLGCDIASGDELLVYGFASRPRGLKNPGLFDYSKYLELNRIYLELKAKGFSSARVIGRSGPGPVRVSAYRLRHKILNFLGEHFDEPYSGFLKAILIGDRTCLDRSLDEDFMKTGTIHILSVSGTHVALIACVIIFIFRLLRIPKKTGMFLAALLLAFYSFSAGLNVPIVRSVIMFAIFALGYILDRESDILNSLAAACFIILLWNPKELFDPSFQLSFGSIAAIVIISPAIDRLFGLEAKGRLSGSDKARFYFMKSVSVSMAAWIGVAPVVSFYFNMTSPVSVIANLVVIPAISLVMVMSLIFLSVGPFSSFFAAASALCIQSASASLFWINHLLSEVPLAYFRTPAPSAPFLLSFYLLLALFIMPKPIIFRRMKIESKHILILTLLIANIFIWQGYFASFGKILKMDILDVGSADAILVRFPGKGVMLVDAGTGGKDRFDAARAVVAPFLWNRGLRRIDAVVVTHPHADHLGGVPYILNNFEVGCVIDNGAGFDGREALERDYLGIIKKKNIPRIRAREGDTIEGFSGVKIFVLNPPGSEDGSDPNRSSIVMKIVYGRSSALLCGDLSGEAIEKILSYGKFLKSDIFKVPHHGGSFGGEERVAALFNAVAAGACMVSSGEGNRPDRAVNNMLKASNFISYETKKDGAINVFLDGKSFSVKVYRKKN